MVNGLRLDWVLQEKNTGGLACELYDIYGVGRVFDSAVEDGALSTQNTGRVFWS